MRFFLLSLLTTCVTAFPQADSPSLYKRCTNTAEDRSCWGDYDVSTDWYTEGPDTGVVREYWWNIVNTTASPDGIERIVLSVNGSVPGPTIIADWGDTIVVHVTNSMEQNGTSIHFHGIRQHYTSQMDGVPSITQCPIAPSDSFTYTWKATQYGSSWWHSHFYVQAWDGIVGGILINGPATSNYDVDLGNLLLTDWSHITADEEVMRAAIGGPPKLDNGLINGTNVYNNSGTVTGSRFETSFTDGTRYRIRLVNTAADTHFKFTIDGHTMEVISADFVPIVPYTADTISIGMGQRYDVVVTANATAGNYWMRAIAQGACSNNANLDNIRGIIRYDAESTDDPVSDSWDDAYVNECVDEESSLMVPYVALPASDVATYTQDFDVALLVSGLWAMGNSSFVNYWDYPTILQAYEGNDTYADSQEVFHLPEADQWVYWVIQTTNAVPHPMHLHGHDFWVLGSGSGIYDPDTADLKLTNVPRRDVVLLPSSGYVVIAFYTDNPGVWLMHCHIAWHTSEGLAVQIMERQTEFVPLLDGDLLSSTCASWDSYAAASVWSNEQDDSGI